MTASKKRRERERVRERVREREREMRGGGLLALPLRIATFILELSSEIRPLTKTIQANSKYTPVRVCVGKHLGH